MHYHIYTRPSRSCCTVNLWVLERVKNLDISDNKTVIRSPFEDNFTEVNTNSIKIAQALNNNEINSIQSDANLDLLEPSEAGLVNIGAPIEANAIVKKAIPAETVNASTDEEDDDYDDIDGTLKRRKDSKEVSGIGNNL